MPLALDAVLLFALSIPVVMRYRILPVVGTPYWLFGILFLVLLINLLVSAYASVFPKPVTVIRLKAILLSLTILIVVGATSVTAIVDRSRTAPVYGVHDIILQQEAAMRFLLEGKNPYKETYFATPVAEFHYDELGKPAVNPALYHFVMPPWYLLFPFIFYFLSIPLLGYFDGRMVLLFCLFGLLIILYRWFKNKQIANLAIVITALSPAFIDYFIEGRSDIFAFFWLVWSLYLLEKKKIFWSSLLFGLALLSKQTTWFAMPFYAVYLWWLSKKSLPVALRSLLPAVVTVVALVSPFLFWDARAFNDSVVFYLSGSAAQSYPVSGYGLGMLLFELGVIKDLHAYYPFIIWQIFLGIPVILGALWWLSKKPQMSRLIIGYGTVLTIMWYLSRYFNNSHLGYISSVLILGVFRDLDERV